jgi:hypothetical protein
MCWLHSLYVLNPARPEKRFKIQPTHFLSEPSCKIKSNTKLIQFYLVNLQSCSFLGFVIGFFFFHHLFLSQSIQQIGDHCEVLNKKPLFSDSWYISGMDSSAAPYLRKIMVSSFDLQGLFSWKTALENLKRSISVVMIL